MTHHWQGIVTRYIGPTNHRPSRVGARSRFRRVVVAWDTALGCEENHRAAAMALAHKMGIGRPAVAGGPEWEPVGAESPDGNGYIYIMVDVPPKPLPVADVRGDNG